LDEKLGGAFWGATKLPQYGQLPVKNCSGAPHAAHLIVCVIVFAPVFLARSRNNSVLNIVVRRAQIFLDNAAGNIFLPLLIFGDAKRPAIRAYNIHAS